ncbi:hypothetical protein BDZ91DRAFT_484582 [Kalaharituber pfeilii]|nr:hypothetical protein BDZ91DRAFT_484582 [Kalaharituber pfeilii]
MEGWLQVPPERNLIGGRGAWKIRYVVFGRDGQRPYPVSPARPTSATVRNSYSLAYIDNRSSLSPQEIRSSYFLSIYKAKHDTEPVARHSIQEIASCYVGDLGIKQKKQVILPTLIIHLKPEIIQVSSPRTFRRRSHDNPYASKVAPQALFFRPSPESPDTLQQWAREIQFYLSACSMSQSAITPITPIESTFPETLQTSTSLFFVNGEPNTALLSPSLRSKCSSDLDNVPSDRRSVSSSSVSELPSPRVDDSAHGQRGRRTLHIATNSEDIDPQELDSRVTGSSAPVESKQETRRETILDRYFSSYPIPIPMDSATASSIARFEALMKEIESQSGNEKADIRKNSLVSMNESISTKDMDIPKRIPTPTLRALEFVSTGVMHPDDELGSAMNSPRNSLVLSEETRRRSSSIHSQYSPSRRNSDSSIGAYSATASSVTGGGAASVVGSLSGFAYGQNQLTCASPRSKRHSISDFSMRSIPSGSGYLSAMTAVGAGGSGISRPGSISEFTHDFNDEATLQKLATAHNYHSRNNKPPPPPSTGALMRDFMF